MKKLQQKLSKVYLRQQAKGGIIDLEEEGKKMLVVTGGEESSSEFTELSPTDYQLGKKKLSFSFNHNLFKIVWAYPVLLDLLVCQLLLRRNKALVKGMAVGKGIQVAEMFLSPFSDLLTGPGGGGKKGANRGGKGKGANKGESNNRSEVTQWHQWLKSSLSCTESTNQSILCSQPNNPESQEEEV